MKILGFKLWQIAEAVNNKTLKGFFNSYGKLSTFYKTWTKDCNDCRICNVILSQRRMKVYQLDFESLTLVFSKNEEIIYLLIHH